MGKVVTRIVTASNGPPIMIKKTLMNKITNHDGTPEDLIKETRLSGIWDMVMVCPAILAPTIMSTIIELILTVSSIDFFSAFQESVR